MFSYYSQWIENFSEKVRRLVQAGSFPMSKSAKQAFKDLKAEVVESVVHSLDESILFVIEADASEFVIAATVNQAGRPVAFVLWNTEWE